MLVLLLVVTVGLLVAIGLFVFNYTRMLGGHGQHATALESAALAAANALSRIVIDDRNYGFVSLSDYPPIGAATIADDGEPLPVLGINTIIGTARLDMLIANKIGNKTMKYLAAQDAKNARAAARNLAEALKAALTEGGSGRDFDGNVVEPYEEAKKAYEANKVTVALGAEPVPGSLKLTLGYLDGGSTTVTPIPQPESLSETDASQRQEGNYKAFINIPVGNESFYFAGVDKQSVLVDPKLWREDDMVRVPSVVKAEADHEIKEATQQGTTRKQIIHTVACAQPYSFTDEAAPGTISISFPSGDVPGITKPGDLLGNPELSDPGLGDNRGRWFTPPDGDWPGEGDLMPTSFGDSGNSPTPAQMWATGFYHWLRTGRTKADIDSVDKMQSKAFSDMGQENQMTRLALRRILPAACAGPDRDKGISLVAILASPPRSSNEERYNALDNNEPEAQAAYYNIAGHKDCFNVLPPNTFIVGQDSQGRLYSADGSRTIDIKDVHEFWIRVAETNYAGLITMAMANQLRSTASVAVETTLTEINNVKASIDALYQQLQSGKLSKEEDKSVANQIDRLRKQLQSLEQMVGTHQAAMDAAEDAVRNGAKAASVTDTLIRNQRTLSSLGFYKEGSLFRIGNGIFSPHPLPPPSAEAIANRTAPSGDTGATDWTSKGDFTVYKEVQAVSYHRQPTYDTLQAARAAGKNGQTAGQTFLFEFDQNGKIVVTNLVSFPFVDVPVSHKQLLGISLSALTSGEEGGLKTVWTAVMRDEAAVLGRVQGGKHAGQPLPAKELRWCQESSEYGDRLPGTQGKGKGKGKGKGVSGAAPLTPDRLDAFLGITPALAGPGGGSGGGNGGPGGPLEGAPPGQAKKLRSTYYCGGLSSDFQIRLPLALNGGQGGSFILNASRVTPFIGVPGSGPATVNLGAGTVTIPGTFNFAIRNQPGPIEPPYTMAPFGNQPTPTVPTLPLGLM